MTWREYHDATKHSTESLRRSRYTLDWANMPDPFRHYEGVPVLDLPADPPAPEVPALDVLLGARGTAGAAAGPKILAVGGGCCAVVPKCRQRMFVMRVDDQGACGDVVVIVDVPLRDVDQVMLGQAVRGVRHS